MQKTLPAFVSLVVIAFGLNHSANRPSHVSNVAQDIPPISYEIADVSISLEFWPPMGWGERLRIDLAGSGVGSCEILKYKPKKDVDRTIEQRELDYSQEKFEELLQALYLAGFFELHEHYDSGDEIMVDSSGHVQVVRWRVFDAVCHTTTLRIGAYTKRVSDCTGEERGPAALSRLEGKILQFNECEIPAYLWKPKPAS